MSAFEERRDVDIALPRETVDTVADALRPLVESVRDLEQRFDELAERVEEQAEAARRADRARKIETLVAEVDRPITGSLLEATFQKPWKHRP